MVVFILLLLIAAGFYFSQEQHKTSNDLIRLHVLANSNYFYDQELKGRVKDRIISETAPEFKKAKNVTEARAMTDALAEKIEQVAREEIKQQGFNYPVQVVRGNFHFPTKTYTIKTKTAGEASLTLPAGQYEAVRVIIGEGKGSNWWCVLYPPLCFVNPRQAIPPLVTPVAAAQEDKPPQEKPKVKSGPNKQTHSPNIEYRFRIVEIIKSLRR